jgi:hypothetical protein
LNLEEEEEEEDCQWDEIDLYVHTTDVLQLVCSTDGDRLAGRASEG